MYRPNLKSVAFPVPEIAIEVLGVCGGGRRGSAGTAPFERAFVTSYRLFIVTFHISLHAPEILPVLCSSTPLFPTPPLVWPKISPCFNTEFNGSTPVRRPLCIPAKIRANLVCSEITVHWPHFKMNWAFKVIQGHPYWCQQKSRMACRCNVYNNINADVISETYLLGEARVIAL